MKFCSICELEATNGKYIVPAYPNQCICEKCYKQLTVCIADIENDETKIALDPLVARGEKMKSAKIQEYPSAILVSPENRKDLYKDAPMNDKAEIVSSEDAFAERGKNGRLSRIGGEMKGTAKSVFWIGAALLIIIGVVLIVQEQSTRSIGLVFLFTGTFLAYSASLLLYVLGTLIERGEGHNPMHMELRRKISKNKAK